MNNREKRFIAYRLDAEKMVLQELEKQYEAALEEIKERITALIGSEDADLPHVIRRREYQQIVKEQVQAALDKLHANEYATISDYLNESYKDGFVGTMYSLHGQGMPLLLPIDRNMIMKAVTIESKLNKSLYEELGIDIVKLQKTIVNELTRGIASGSLYPDIAQKISIAAKIPIKRANAIVRTEAGRIQEEATMDAARLTKEKGADVVKQWCAILDGKTRDSHRRLDGQIREIEEYFEIDGKRAMQPHGFGVPEEDCNCRCTTLIRARAALDASELKTLQDRARYFELDKTKEFEEFKKKYLKAAETLDKSGKSGIMKSVIDPMTGEYFSFAKGSKIQNAEVFAGSGAKKPLRVEVAEGLAKEFGGLPDKWQHSKGIGTLDYYGEEVKAEIHWFQEESVGKVKFKVKEWIE